jgi:ABC-type nitrate/sulfonate/bicarbonate transport system substrate-binding protein
LSIAAPQSRAASEAGDILEKSEIVLAYPQPSGVFTPVFVAEETGLFKIHGLNVKLPQLNLKAAGAGGGYRIGGQVRRRR